MQLKRLAVNTISILVSIIFLIYIWNISLKIFYIMFGKDSYGLSEWMLAIINPKQMLAKILWTYNYSIPTIIVLLSFLTVNLFKTVKRKNPYLVYIGLLILVYLIIIFYNVTFDPNYEDCKFTWLDDIFGQNTNDFNVFFGYFLSHIVFIIIYIPIWKKYLRWINIKFD